jgi:hypothetical protein
MDVIDPRDLSDRQLFAHLVFGSLPRRGWSGRRRAMAIRILQVAGLTLAIALGMLVASAAIVLVWAAMQAPA